MDRKLYLQFRNRSRFWLNIWIVVHSYTELETKINFVQSISHLLDHTLCIVKWESSPIAWAPALFSDRVTMQYSITQIKERYFRKKFAISNFAASYRRRSDTTSRLAASTRTGWTESAERFSNTSWSGVAWLKKLLVFPKAHTSDRDGYNFFVAFYIPVRKCEGVSIKINMHWTVGFSEHELMHFRNIVSLFPV